MKIFNLTVSMQMLVMAAVVGCREEPGDKGRKPDRIAMPVDVAPFYDSRGLKISVGEYSKELASADSRTILQISNNLKKEKDRLRAEVMYVAAIRLYDLSQKDEAVYWFYTAQYRARVFKSILDKQKIGGIGAGAFELEQAYNAFNQLASDYINGYAGGDLTKTINTLTKVLDEGASLPKFTEVYPEVAFSPRETWDEKNKKVAEGLTKLIEHFKTDGDSIKKKRKENGMEGKY